MKLGRAIKFIVVNLIIFAILVVALNWVCGIYLRRASKSNRSELPNYERDREHARTVFAEYNAVSHRYEPFVGWRTLPFKGKTTNISNEGVRTHSMSGNGNGQDTLVVRFFGGSTMWGEGSDDDHTIPALFNARQRNAEVFNHGQLAYNTRQELDALISLYAKDAQTDVVVFYDGVNDAAFLCPTVINDLPAHRLVPMYRDKLYRGTGSMVKELMSKLFIENILGTIRHLSGEQENTDRLYDCHTDAEKAEEIADMFMKNWEMAHEIVTKRNGRFLAVLQPAAFISNPRVDHLQLDPVLEKNFKEIYGRIKNKIAERNHSWIIDLSDKFDNNEHIFIDFCHVSPNGNEIIAEEIYKALVDNAIK